MPSAVIPIPVEFASACADAVEFAHFGGKLPSGLALIQNWMTDDGWTLLADQWDGTVVLCIGAAPFNDESMRAQLELADDEKISDRDRISFAKQWLEEALDENDSYVLPSLHMCKIERADGISAVVACTVTIFGQGGPDLTWHGAFKNEVALRSYLSGNGFDLEIDPERIDGDYIKRFWSLR